MIEIDGSKGGGQILRTAVALSALLKEPVRITGIRTGKEKAQPGLKPQHMLGIKTLAEFSNASVFGLTKGSLQLQFLPKELEMSSKKIDIGTAGSITLLLQTLLPVAIFSKKHLEFEIIGGTEVSWSPTIQYFQNVTLPVLRMLGVESELEVVQHGYYPKGKGKVIFRCKPVKKLSPIRCFSRGKIKGFFIESVCGNYQPDIARRQGEAAIRALQFKFPDSKISLTYKSVQSLSPGLSCTCFAKCENSVLGTSLIAERGLLPEDTGKDAAEDLIRTMQRNVCLDKFMADQIVPFLALADGESSVSIEGVTAHLLSNIYVVEKMLPVKFEVKDGQMTVRGIGWKG